MSPKVLLFGAGGHGRVVAAQMQARFHGLSLQFGDSGYEIGTSVNGIDVVANAIKDFADAKLIVTIGNNTIREKLQTEAGTRGVTLAQFIADPHSYFSAPPGSGSMILAGSVVTADVQIEEGVIVNSNACVEHDSVVGAFSHIAPGAVLAGGCRLGRRVFVGANATIVNGARIADDVVIGAGAVVPYDIRVAGTYVGVPASRVNGGGASC